MSIKGTTFVPKTRNKVLTLKPVFSMEEKFVMENEILFTDVDIFKDKNEHPYDCQCYDGYAIGIPVECEENCNAPKVKLTYPLREDVLKDNRTCELILEYRGLYDLSKDDITFADIMFYCGKLEVL